MQGKINVESLSSEDLKELRQKIAETLDFRRRGTGITVHRYEFNESYAPALQPKPYVAKLTLGAEGKIERSFYDIPKTGKGVQRVTLNGWYQAADFDLIEDEHSNVDGGKPVLYNSISIAFRGELCEISWPTQEVTDLEIIEYLSGNRAIFLDAVKGSLDRSRLRPDHPYNRAVEGLVRELSR